MSIFLIKRLWVDTLENRDAYGYDEVGYVTSKEEAERISDLEYIPKSSYPWPLKYATEFKGENVPRFIYEKVELGCLDGYMLRVGEEVPSDCDTLTTTGTK